MKILILILILLLFPDISKAATAGPCFIWKYEKKSSAEFVGKQDKIKGEAIEAALHLVSGSCTLPTSSDSINDDASPAARKM